MYYVMVEKDCDGVEMWDWEYEGTSTFVQKPEVKRMEFKTLDSAREYINGYIKENPSLWTRDEFIIVQIFE